MGPWAEPAPREGSRLDPQAPSVCRDRGSVTKGSHPSGTSSAPRTPLGPGGRAPVPLSPVLDLDFHIPDSSCPSSWRQAHTEGSEPSSGAGDLGDMGGERLSSGLPAPFSLSLPLVLPQAAQRWSLFPETLGPPQLLPCRGAVPPARALRSACPLLATAWLVPTPQHTCPATRSPLGCTSAASETPLPRR